MEKKFRSIISSGITTKIKSFLVEDIVPIKRPLPEPKNCDKNKNIIVDYYSIVIVQNITERDNIPCKLRQNGMIAIVVEEAYAQYQLETSLELDKCNNLAWELRGDGILYHNLLLGKQGGNIELNEFYHLDKATYDSLQKGGGTWDFTPPVPEGLQIIDLTV